MNATDLEGWMAQGKATAIDYSLNFFNDIKRRGMQIILISSRKEYLRDATIDNLVDAGFHGWKSLYLRYAMGSFPSSFAIWKFQLQYVWGHWSWLLYQPSGVDLYRNNESFLPYRKG